MFRWRASLIHPFLQCQRDEQWSYHSLVINIVLFCYWILSQWLNLHRVTHQTLLLTAPLLNTAKPLIAIFTFAFCFGQRFEPLICSFLLIRNRGYNEEHNRSVSGRVVRVSRDLWSTCWRRKWALMITGSLVVSYALKGRRTLSITPAINNHLVIIVHARGWEFFFHIQGLCFSVSWQKGALRKVLQGDWGLCKLSPHPKTPSAYHYTPELLSPVFPPVSVWNKCHWN